jgi:hypothetical protein
MHECKYGCGYGHKHRGTVNLHETKHCKLKGASNPTSEKPRIATSHCDCSDGGSWRMLTSNEKRISDGLYTENYKEVCETCRELR